MTEKKQTVESTVKNIRRKSKKKYSAEEKIRIVLEGLRVHKLHPFHPNCTRVAPEKCPAG